MVTRLAYACARQNGPNVQDVRVHRWLMRTKRQSVTRNNAKYQLVIDEFLEIIPTVWSILFPTLISK